jgi:diaminohydroxyphosphoribosylaminopyrimidine deaminase / 5-amino-6-(5-phosphoribosylamino)uracil reductase
MAQNASPDVVAMRRALVLARRALGNTSPNPLVGAVVVRKGRILGEGYHHRAGQPHAEIEALRDCRDRGHDPRGATLVVTLEPCSTTGRTPPCTQAILEAGLRRVVVGTVDPNPHHAGRGLTLLRETGLEVVEDVCRAEAEALNPGFNHWIVHRRPLITLKAAMTLDGKIATTRGDSRWITGEAARRVVMRLRQENDAILVGIGTVLADDPQLTIRRGRTPRCGLRIVLDSRARIPLTSQLLTDAFAGNTLVVVGDRAPKTRIDRIQARSKVWVAPTRDGRICLSALCTELGRRGITSVLVEGGGEVHAGFLQEHLAHRIAFFYAPKIVGGREAPRSVGGIGWETLGEAPRLEGVRWRTVGDDLLLTASIRSPERP